MTHSHSVIVQAEDYYPFGMSFNQYKAPDKLANSFLFNAGSELNEETELYGTFYRNYDPAVGRLTGVDPYAGLYVGHNPYHYALNDPANYNDPTGGNVMPIAFEDDDSGGGGIFFGFGDGGTSSWNNGLSASHWVNQVWGSAGATGVERNARMMSGSEFYGFYGINDGNKADIAQRVGTTYQIQYASKWVESGWAYHDPGDTGWDYIAVMQYNLVEEYNFVAQNGGMIDFSNSSLALDIGGGMFGAMEGLTTSQGKWLGKNGKYYSTGWGGNRYSGSRAGALKAAGTYRLAGRATVFVSAGIGIYSTIEGYQMDGDQFGYNAQMAAVGSAGSIVGGIAGAKAGAAVGAVIGAWFGGVGAIPGAVIGGVIGGFGLGIGGSYLGGYLGEGAVNYYHGR